MARSLSERLHDQIVAHEIDLKRFEASDRLGVLAFLDLLRDKLVADVARVAPSDPARLTDRRRRLEALLVSIDKTIKTGFQDLTKQERSLMVGLADMEQKWAAQSLNRALRVDVASVSSSASTLTTLVNDTLLEGTPWQNTWNGIGVQARRKVAQEIRLGVAAGETTPDIARRIRGTRAAGFSDGVWRTINNQSMSLVRTQVQAISNQAREDAYKQQGNLVKGLQWVATLDTRTSVICMSLDGKVWELETKKPVGHSQSWPGPTAHINCFAGEVSVSSPSGASKLYRRSYSGELITVETVDGRRMRATTNHPVLTPTGWKPVGELNVGDELVCQNGTGRTSRSPQDQGRVTTFEELACATAKLEGVRSVQMPVAGPDFHGDGSEGEICQIWTYGELSLEGNTTLNKLLRKSPFESRNIEIPVRSLSGIPGGDFSIGSDAAANSIMGSAGAGLLSTLPASVEFFGLRPGNPGSDTPSSESCESYIELYRYMTRRELIRDVEIDRVSVVRSSEAVSVPVHNLETPTGWYLASGIVSHNCRSTQIAITRSFDEFEKAEGVDVERRFRRKLGEQWDKNPRLQKRTNRETFVSRNFASARASMDGQVSASIKFPEWLKQKDREQPGFADRLLGKERGKLWRTGKATIQQMVDQTNRPLTLPELAKKALK